MNWNATRRRFLQLSGGAAGLVLPFIDRNLAYAAVTPKKRLLIFTTPNGTLMNDLWPASGSNTYGPILAPLQSLQSKILLLRGVDLKASVGAPVLFHSAHYPALLTGRTPQGKQYSPTMEGISVDQHIANIVGPQTRIRSLELGVGSTSSATPLISRGYRQTVFPDTNPYRAFGNIFGSGTSTGTGSGGGTGTQPDPAIERLRLSRKSVLDSVRQQLTAVRCALGPSDRIAFEAHLESVRELEKELTTAPPPVTMEPPPPVTTCVAPTQGTPVLTQSSANIPKLVQLQIDLAVAAFACDATRVVSIQIDSGASEIVHRWASSSITTGHHTISHNAQVNGDPAQRVAWLLAIEKWFAQQFATLANKLNSIPDGNGTTLLDNTACLWMHEQNDGQRHVVNDLPVVIAGGCGGFFKTGRQLNLGGRSTNDLLISLAAAMDAPVTTFGNPALCTGAIASLR